MQSFGERTPAIAGAVRQLSSWIGEINRATDEVAREAVTVPSKASFDIDILNGRGAVKAEDISDHYGFRFGQWYDFLADKELTRGSAYRRISEPHIRVYVTGQAALARSHAGDFEAAVIAAGDMERASGDVFAALGYRQAARCSRIGPPNNYHVIVECAEGRFDFNSAPWAPIDLLPPDASIVLVE